MSELDRIREVDAMMVDITGKSLSLEELEAIANKISQIESESFDRGVLKEQSLQRAILEEVRSIGIQQGYDIGYEEGKREGYEEARSGVSSVSRGNPEGTLKTSQEVNDEEA